MLLLLVLGGSASFLWCSDIIMKGNRLSYGLMIVLDVGQVIPRLH